MVGGWALQLKEGSGKAPIRAKRGRMRLPQHPGALDMLSVATTSKHGGIFQLLCSFVDSLAFKSVLRKLWGVTERSVGRETLSCQRF